MLPDIRVVEDDVLRWRGDVVALKYADAWHGADRAVSERLKEAGRMAPGAFPDGDAPLWIASEGALPSAHVVFVPLPPLHRLGYADLRWFTQAALTEIGRRQPGTRTIALTLHGPGFGLDEREALRAEIAGVLDALRDGGAPPGLASVTFVERRRQRAERLARILRESAGADRPIANDVVRDGDATRDVPVDPLPIDVSGDPLIGASVIGALFGPLSPRGAEGEPDTPRTRGGSAVVTPFPRSTAGDAARPASHGSPWIDVGEASDAKPRVFVAMPFNEDMEDVFHYGIEKTAHRAGLLCERADLAIFTGDILNWIHRRIQGARVVVADLTGANPNVMLEVGYAWGCGIETVLVVRCGDDGGLPDDLPFDVRGQKCLRYRSIRDLEQQLRPVLQTFSQQPSAGTP